ncbi:MAG: hypothetical protein ACK5M4_13445 [Pseudorhodobacter sp.]
MMPATRHITGGCAVLALVACAPGGTVPLSPGPVVLGDVAYDVALQGGGILVQRSGRPLENWEGAEARRAADAFCRGRATSSIRDRFTGDGWLIVEGCA